MQLGSNREFEWVRQAGIAEKKQGCDNAGMEFTGFRSSLIRSSRVWHMVKHRIRLIVLSSLALALIVAEMESAQLKAQAAPTPSTADSNDAENWPKIVVPNEDKSEVLVAFIRETKARRPRTPAQYIEMQSGVRDAAKRILEIKDLKQTSPEIHLFAEKEYVASSVMLLSHDNPETQDSTIAKFLEYLSDRNPVNELDQQLVVLVGQNAELTNDAEKAISVYTKIIEILESKKDAGLKGFIAFVQSAVKRLKLIDHKLELKSKSMDGKEFDMESLKGSYVLVCFWATFSPPSVAEIKRIQSLLPNYESKGLRVVSICMDESTDESRKQIESLQLPWIQLWDQVDIERLPISFELGISAVPTMMLLDQEGTVILLQNNASSVRLALDQILSGEVE